MAEIPTLPLKTIFYIHFILIGLSFIGSWGASGYLYYNVVFTVVLLWCLFDLNSPEPVQHAIYVNVIAFAFDFFYLILRFPHSGGFAVWFGVIMGIIQFFVRPITTVSLRSVLQERSGNIGQLGPFEGVGNIFGGPQRNYEDIDRRDPIPVSTSQEDPDFFRPRQI